MASLTSPGLQKGAASVNTGLDYLTARLEPVPGSAVAPHGGLDTSHIEEIQTVLRNNSPSLRNGVTLLNTIWPYSLEVLFDMLYVHILRRTGVR